MDHTGATLALPADFPSRLAPPLIGIDGLPCAGKTTLAMRLGAMHGFACLHVDEFLRPEREWRGCQPGFPFPYIRYEAFLQAVTDLATQGECHYAPFDPRSGGISAIPRHLTTQRPVIVEGVSALVPLLEPFYGLKIFVDSDRNSVIEAAQRRNLGIWPTEWRKLFLPSADLYMLTHPERRADLVLPGRGKPGLTSRDF